MRRGMERDNLKWEIRSMLIKSRCRPKEMIMKNGTQKCQPNFCQIAWHDQFVENEPHMRIEVLG